MGKTFGAIVGVAIAVAVGIWYYSYMQDRLLEERNKVEQQYIENLLRMTTKTKELIKKTDTENRRLLKLTQFYTRRARLAEQQADSLKKELALIQLPEQTPPGCEAYAAALELCKARGDKLELAIADRDSAHTVDSLRADTLNATLNRATVTIVTQDSTIKELNKKLEPKKFLGLFRLPRAVKNLPLLALVFFIGYAAH